MASPLIESMTKELSAIDSIYSSDFAGQSRATRDVAQIAELVQRTKALLAKVEAIPVAARGPELSELTKMAKENLKTYETERVAIQKAKEAGPETDEFALLATEANFVFARYFRHFAGQNRATRDIDLLGEMNDDLKQIQKRMQAVIAANPTKAEFKSDLSVVEESLGRYQSELREIEKAQTSGTDEEQANALAQVANEQFLVYQTHFAGQSRATRRPALLARVVTSLKRTRERMIAILEKGFAEEFHRKNAEIVAERLAVYEGELGEIRKARQSTAMGDLMGLLGGAANDLFNEYRANFADKNRADVDRKLLGAICDRLGEVGRQMAELGRADSSEVNARNREIVYEQLALFEREYEAVSSVQAPKNS